MHLLKDKILSKNNKIICKCNNTNLKIIINCSLFQKIQIILIVRYNKPVMSRKINFIQGQYPLDETFYKWSR